MEIKSVLCVASVVLIFAACTAVHARSFEYRCERYINNNDLTLFGCQRIAMMLRGGNAGCCANNRDGEGVIWSYERDGAVPQNDDRMCPFCFAQIEHPQLIFKYF